MTRARAAALRLKSPAKTTLAPDVGRAHALMLWGMTPVTAKARLAQLMTPRP